MKQKQKNRERKFQIYSLISFFSEESGSEILEYTAITFYDELI